MHLFSGPIDLAAEANRAKDERAEPSQRVSMPELLRRIEILEAEVSELKKQL
jgi:uncharacterized protein YceH (UPF0502 family)